MSTRTRRPSYSDSEEEGEIASLSDDPSSEEEGAEEEESEQVEEAGGKASSAPVPLKKRKALQAKASSPAEVDSSESEFDDGYDEDLYIDEADRRALEKMPELEREQILNERYEKRKAALERFQMRKKLKEKQMKRSSSEASRSSRSRALATAKESKQAALSKLSAKRKAAASSKTKVQSKLDISSESAEEEEEEEEEYVDTTERRSASHSARQNRYKEAEEEDEEENEAAREKVRRRDVQEQEPPTLDQFNKLRLSRNQLEKWIELPIFAENAPGFFVRVGLGLDNNQRRTYRVAEIISVQEGEKRYQVGKLDTLKVLEIAHASHGRTTFKVSYVSNSEFTPSEYTKWVAEMKKEGLPFPSRKDIEKKQDALRKLQNYVYTEADVDRIVKGNLRRKGKHPRLAAYKAQLMSQLKAAEEAGNLEEYPFNDLDYPDISIQTFEFFHNYSPLTVEQISKSLAKVKQSEESRKTEDKGINIADLNKRNKLRNVELTKHNQKVSFFLTVSMFLFSFKY
ncbi:RNA polymerase-associated protein rtf1 [Balamuthia mandrillaris]